MMTKEEKNKIFKTDNFPLAAFLLTKGCNLVSITKKGSHHSFFNFENTPERQKLTQEFWRERSLVEPRTFFNAQRELKTFLYDDSYPTDS